MPSETLPGMKICVACQTDVAGKKRMKDSKGRYWCYDCGTEDQRLKDAGEPGLLERDGDPPPPPPKSAAPAKPAGGDMVQCKHCKGVFPKPEMTDAKGGGLACKRCHNKRLTQGRSKRGQPTPAADAGPADTAQQVKVTLALLAAVGVLLLVLWVLGVI